jgi:hypothetical protein
VAVRLRSIVLFIVLILAIGGFTLSRGKAPPVEPPPADGPSAADTYDWGEPDADLSREFGGSGFPSPYVWASYDSVGHDGNGLRRPQQNTVQDGYLQIAGLSDATTGGLMSRAVYPAFGRWEARMRVDEQGPGKPYHAVVALIPAGVPYDGGAGDLDFAEADVGSGAAHMFVHYPPRKQAYATAFVDLAEWHTYAIEVARDHISWFVDGKIAMTTTEHGAIIGVDWTMNIQLDAYFPSGLAPSNMQVDYFRFYPIPESGARLIPGPLPTITDFG